MLVVDFEKSLIESGKWRTLFLDFEMPDLRDDGSWTTFDGKESGNGVVNLCATAWCMSREEALFNLSTRYKLVLDDREIPKETKEKDYIKPDVQPHESIIEFVDEILVNSKAPRTNLAIASVLITLSVLLAGSYTSPDSHGALSLYYIAHARAAGGKGSYGTIPRQILDEVDTDFCDERCGGLSLPQSIQAFLMAFDHCNKRYMEAPEAGEFFDDLRDKRSMIYALRPKFRSAWNGEYIQGTLTKKKQDSCPACPYPVFTLWCAMTATQAKEMMEDRRTAIDGLLSRISFITTTETKLNETSSGRLFLSHSIMTKLKNLSKRSIEQMEEHKKNGGEALDENTLRIRIGEKKQIKISSEAWVLAKSIEENCRKEVQALSNDFQDVMASLIARLYEKTMRVASLIAAFDCAELSEDEWRIQTSHIEWAYKWERNHIDNLKDIASLASEESGHAKLKKSIMMAIDSIDPMKRRDGYWVTYSDMRVTNKGSLRNAKPLEISQALIDLEEAGIIQTDRESHTNKKPKLIRKV